MLPFLSSVSFISGALSVAGQCQSLLGSVLLSRFVHLRNREEHSAPFKTDDHAASWPKISVLKPLHGDEPLLEEALESFFKQDYPEYELVFGVQRTDDPALAVIERLRTRYPAQPVFVVCDSTDHGPNRKVGNLINMQQACHHDVFVISDSDIHVEPQYLRHIASTLLQSETQLVTTLYAGLPASTQLARLFGAHSINANFLPGVMMSRLLGRQDCLGATMALTRQRLDEVGGFTSLVAHIADDSELGNRILRQQGTIALAPTLCLTTVAENNFRELISHEIRWGRTVRSIEPVGYACSSLQLPLFWATLCVAFAPTSPLSWGLLIGGWLLRSFTTQHTARLTKCSLPGIFPYLVLRDWLSAAVMLASACGSRVAWRGRTVHITRNTTHTSSRRHTHTPPDPSSPTVNGPGVDRSDINRSVRS